MDYLHSDTIKIREIDGAQVLDTLNCALISERFFHRSRAWFIQRLNNNIVNGKPAYFTSEELSRLRSSLKTLSSEILYFMSNIPKTSPNMSIKVYVIDDPEAIFFFQNDDVEGFKQFLANDDGLDFGEPEFFDTEIEALAFCAGIGYGVIERATVDRYPLRSCESCDIPFIEAIENY